MLSNYTAAFVTLATSNLDKLVLFYTELWQQEPQIYRENVYAEFEISGLRLGIFQPQQSKESEFASSQSSRMSLCLEVKDLESVIAHLTNIGYPPTGEIVIASHGKEIYACDPDGNRLILHQS
ncbi:glyoxalase/bleomycin resistance/dioxygenase family protein [Synechocystis sp. PCC 7509]|uniref:glyoxalase/bleomycin resistance/dioxygenase family protein n=1 Tax=Synechocystis sp. PCC 7509 TaxID=927677 RepID=UPI00048F9662|nr:glyoxalase/bleomycin resistance/dioxygenase family protein [Synechocystis sp. PCC 7509]